MRGARGRDKYRRDWIVSIRRRRVLSEWRVFMGGRATFCAEQLLEGLQWETPLGLLTRSARLLSMEDRRMPGQSHAFQRTIEPIA